MKQEEAMGLVTLVHTDTPEETAAKIAAADAETERMHAAGYSDCAHGRTREAADTAGREVAFMPDIGCSRERCDGTGRWPPETTPPTKGDSMEDNADTTLWSIAPSGPTTITFSADGVEMLRLSAAGASVYGVAVETTPEDRQRVWDVLVRWTERR